MKTIEALDELLTTASAGLDSAKFSEGLHRRAKNAKGQELAAEASEALRLVCCGLEALGATTPTQRAMRAASNPLAALARVENSRSEALALLDALRHALPLAEALDAKRGWTIMLLLFQKKIPRATTRSKGKR